MTTKLEKVFETTRDYFGFKNDLTISCSYDEANDSAKDIEAFCYNQRKGTCTTLTEIFETVPELITLVDNINWREINAVEKEAKEEVYDEQ